MTVPLWSALHKVDAQALLLKLQHGGINAHPQGLVLFYVVAGIRQTHVLILALALHCCVTLDWMQLSLSLIFLICKMSTNEPTSHGYNKHWLRHHHC